MSDPNRLYYGDNLDVLRRHVKDESVDLIYLDPPFNSNQSYNVLFSENSGERAASQIQAFEDTWRWDEAAARAYSEIVEGGGQVADVMRAFRTALPDRSDMLAYLSMMAPRLVELRRVMKPTASLYLHCDPAASHYLKVLLDAVFGAASYRTEIIWRRGQGFKRSSAKRFPHKHDVIFFYAKDPAQIVFNPQFRPHKPEYIRRFKTDADTGRLYRDDVNPTAGGRRRIYLDDVAGDLIDSIWDDINPVNPVARERLGYPTQKPEALLERIILASSNEGDVVLDPFCGCGTAVAVAQRLDRRWIGIDVTHLAVGLIRRRMMDAFGDDVTKTFQVVGEPTDLEGARELASSDPYQFQYWVLGLVGARPAEQKKGADKGIDGRIYFHEGLAGGETRSVVISVKAGKLHAPYVRDLRGVMEREEAQIGVLLCMESPTPKMRAEAASAGFYKPVVSGSHPRLQIITVADLLDGHGIDYPGRSSGGTFRQAPRAKPKAADQPRLTDVAEGPAEYDA